MQRSRLNATLMYRSDAENMVKMENYASTLSRTVVENSNFRTYSSCINTIDYPYYPTHEGNVENPNLQEGNNFKKISEAFWLITFHMYIYTT